MKLDWLLIVTGKQIPRKMVRLLRPGSQIQRYTQYANAPMTAFMPERTVGRAVNILFFIILVSLAC